MSFRRVHDPGFGMFETGAYRGSISSQISLRQTGAEPRADSISAATFSDRAGLSPGRGPINVGRALTNNRDDDRRARQNGHPSSNGWPNFDLASFLDAYYHPKNRTIPAPRRMSAGPEMDRPASPMPLAPQTAGLSSTNVSSSQSVRPGRVAFKP